MCDTSGVNVLSAFMSTERPFFANDVKRGNVFAFSLAQTIRYRNYLGAITDRYASLSGEHFRFIAEQMQLPDGDYEIGDDEEARLRALSEVAFRIQYEVESFYLFAKVLLDKVAQFILCCFGEHRELGLNSHHKLIDHIESYARAKELALPDGLVSLAKNIKVLVSDFRDKLIAHDASPRTIHAFMSGPSGGVRIAWTKLYPGPREKQRESSDLLELLSSIDDYLTLITNFVHANQDRYAISLPRHIQR